MREKVAGGSVGTMTEHHTGPIDYLALEFPTAELKGEGLLRSDAPTP